MVTKQILLDSIKKLDLQGKTISLHSSYKSFGGVNGGPNTIIDAFLESNCTLLVPTFTYDYAAYPPMDGKKYEQNGVDMSIYDEEDKIFKSGYSKNSRVISPSMGIIPKLILEREEAVRGVHPLNSFTAIGPKAKDLIDSQSYIDVYAPYKKCMEDKKSVLLLMGIDFKSTTPIHFAEELSGRNLFRQWAYIDTGEVIEASIGSCSNGFNKLIPFVLSIKKQDLIGKSTWQIYNFKKYISTLTSVIKSNQSLTICDNSKCIRCRDSVLGGPIL